MPSFSFATLFTTFFVISSALALPQSSPIKSYILPGNNTFPEGVARQPNSQYFFTGSSTDGTIYRGDVGNPKIEVFIPANSEESPSSAFGMKVDNSGRLYVAGGTSGVLSIYDVNTRELLHRFSNNLNGTFLNDLAFGDDGTVYVTDSFLPNIYRIPAPEICGKATALDQKLEIFTSLPPSFNFLAGAFKANGVLVTPNQRYLIVGNWNERSLYRVCLETKRVDKIDLGCKEIGKTDGLLFRDSLIYSVNSDYSLGLFVDVIEIHDPYLAATPLRQITSPLIVGPATAAWDGEDILLTNFQGPAGVAPPQLPFTIVRVPSC